MYENCTFGAPLISHMLHFLKTGLIKDNALLYLSGLYVSTLGFPHLYCINTTVTMQP